MSNMKSLLLVATAAVMPLVVGAFDASANTNMAVYWGQGPNQQRLAHFCADTNIDIIPIGFINQFPDQTGGYPGSNFGNQCGSSYYKNPDGSTSKLLSSCPDIGPDIKTCQALGKKILLSLGGAIPNNQHSKSTASATNFATFLWRAFGPDKESSTSTFPRPFGNAVVDGFDFDIENTLASGENPQDLYLGYATMVNTLRQFYAKETSKSYYISAAPQCVVPDAHLANAIENSHFDFIFVQFYNTAQCSARAYFDHTYGAYGGPATNISFDSWVNFVKTNSQNVNAKVFLGLPASTSNNIVTDSKMYLQPAEAQKIIDAFQCKYPTHFGGVMIYEATASEANLINGKPYADVLKGYLTSSSCAERRSIADPVVSSVVLSAPAVSSSSPPYPLGTGASYPGIASGSAPTIRPSGYPSGSYTFRSGTAPYSIRTGTAPISSGTAPLSIKTGTAPTNPSGTGSSGPSASASSPVLILSSSSRGPYTNSSAPFPSATETGPAASTTDVVTTEIVTVFTTTCPVTSTIISGGSQVLSTGLTTSTVYSTITRTICTRCVAPPTPAPSNESGTNSPAPASTREVITTVIIYTTTTTCPVTQTFTSAGSTFVQTKTSVSTFVGTTTSTIAVLPASKAPTFATVAASSSPEANSASSPQQPANGAPANQNSPGQGNAPANSPSAGSSTTGSQGNSRPNSPVNVSENSPANAAAAASPSSITPVFETLTMVPVPVTATETDHPAKPTNGAQSANSAASPPYIAKNGTSPASSSGIGSGNGPSPFQTPAVAFKGAASRMSGGVGMSLVVGLVAALML